MRQQSATNAADRRLAALAARQHGVVSTAQLRVCGLKPSAVTRRVKGGRLHPVHRGVFAVGHSGLGNEGSWMGAVLACGDGAALSHRSAAQLWGLPVPRPERPEVTVRGSGGRRHRGVHVHRSQLGDDERTIRNGIPVTGPERTLADLRSVVTAVQLMRATRQAEFLGLVELEAGRERTRSQLERRFLRLCRDVGFPAPLVNHRVGPYEVDFLWPDRRLIVETDGYRAHRGRVAFQSDRTRDVDLRLLGYEVVRVSWAQVAEGQIALVRLLRSRLS